MTVCCQNLTLGALISRSALSMLVGALFKNFGLFLNTPRTFEMCQVFKMWMFYLVAASEYVMLTGRN
jgi:hypothetical protein